MHRPLVTVPRIAILCTAVPALVLSFFATACQTDKVPEPAQKTSEKTEEAAEKTPKPVATATATATAAPTATAPAAPRIPARPTATVPVSEGDPLKGVWSLDDATKGLAKDGKLFATVDTEAGKLDCELWDDKAPLTVANFIGLARGLRPWKTPEGSWVKKALYNGTVFHRIIKGFMIQGGDPKGDGSGDPGYVVPDEIWENGSHDERGLLCMANRGPNTNGAQFFILDAASTYLDGKYTIFGKCGPGEVIEKLASHQVVGDKAINPPKIKKVTIERRAAKP